MQDFDLHMHSTYCDGSNSAEEMIRSAIDHKLRTVGLSGHSFTPFDTSYCMSREGTEQYIAEVTALKKKYADRINVLLGLEMDYYADTDTSSYDYLIGSVHYLFTEDGSEWTPVDEGPYFLRSFALKHGMDMMSVARLYYETVGSVVSRTNCDIIGHFDLLTKFNERYRLEPDESVIDTFVETEAKCRVAMSDASEQAAASGDASGDAAEQCAESSETSGIAAEQCDSDTQDETIVFFDTADPEYVVAWKKAIDRIFEECAARYKRGYRNRLETLGILEAGDKPVFEINTGAISKGYRTTPYPSADQMDYIRSKGGILILSSDSHKTDTICSEFDKYDSCRTQL